jgi:NAD(P)-dependent dehydrogenase (short-subunit alcohol dehydrogenase family)
MDLAGKRVVISGGSSGIGKALAIQVAKRGASVAILARDAGRLESARAEIAAAGNGKVIAVSVDVTSDASVEAGAAKVLAELGGIDVLIANQGYARCAPIWETSIDDFQAIMNTNFYGHVRLVKAFVPTFRAQQSGSICLVASMLAFMSFYGYGPYSASKHAIVGFSEALRQEMGLYNVHVNLHFPPTTETPGLTEENKTKPPVTWAIEESSRKFTSEQVAASILAGIDQNRLVNLIGVDSWFIYVAKRFAPWLVRFFIDSDLKKGIKKNGLPAV